MTHRSGKPIIGNHENASNTVMARPVYGIQRTYRYGFFNRLEWGVAYVEDDFTVGLGLILATSIGWVLRKRR